MTNTELLDIRKRIKFDMSSMSVCLGIPKSTYQRYENGSAKVPDNIARAAKELEQINVTFMADLPARVDERVRREFPHGIMSEVAAEF